MERPGKVAMPEATVTAEPPVSVPPPGLVAMARLTVVALSAVSTLPLASSTATVTEGVTVAPAATLEGPWMKASLVGGPGVTLKAAEVGLAVPALLGAVVSRLDVAVGVLDGDRHRGGDGRTGSDVGRALDKGQ